MSADAVRRDVDLVVRCAGKLGHWMRRKEVSSWVGKELKKATPTWIYSTWWGSLFMVVLSRFLLLLVPLEAHLEVLF